jgi:hypothetical protein
MQDRIRVIPHEAVPKCGSYEVRFPDGRASRFFYWDDVAGRRLRPDMVDSFTAKQAAQYMARNEQAELDSQNLVVFLTVVLLSAQRLNFSNQERSNRQQARGWGHDARERHVRALHSGGGGAARLKRAATASPVPRGDPTTKNSVHRRKKPSPRLPAARAS